MNAVQSFGTLYMLFWGSGYGGIFNYQELEKIWGAICNLNKVVWMQQQTSIKNAEFFM